MFGKIHETILLGKLTKSQHGSTRKIDENDANLKFYNAEGVSFPLGHLFAPSGFGHTLFFDPPYKKIRSLSTLGCWLLIGGTIAQFPQSGPTEGEFGKLPTHFNHPEVYFYEVEIAAGICNYSTAVLSHDRSGQTSFSDKSLHNLGKGYNRHRTSDLRDDERATAISKALVYLRRHGAEREGGGA